MKKSFAVIAVFALAMSGLVISRVGTSGAAPPVPLFTQCPAVDTDTGCAVLLSLRGGRHAFGRMSHRLFFLR